MNNRSEEAKMNVIEVTNVKLEDIKSRYVNMLKGSMLIDKTQQVYVITI